MPFAAAIARHAEQIPHVPAFRMEGRVFTFRELALCAGQLVSAFGNLTADSESENVLPGTTTLIALEIGNHPLFAAAFAAATSGGHCVALIDPHLPDATRLAMRELLRPDVLVRADGDGLRLDATATGQSITFTAGSGDDSSPIAIGADDEPFLVVFTSGTTGMPKAIVRDRGSWRRSLKTGPDFFGTDGNTRTFAPGPLAHGLTLYALAETLVAGAEFVGMAHFDAARASETIASLDVRRLVLVPTVLRRLCTAPSASTSVRKITVAGAKLTPADRAAAAKTLPQAEIIEYYGASELGFISVAGPGDTASATAVGRAFPGVGLIVLDENERPLASGETGTIFVDSDLISNGYIGAGDGAGLRRVGRLATVGDLGFLDADGTLHLVGRSGGMVLSCGNNIYPQEVEATLSGHADVHAAFVLGLDHPDLGSELVAVIEPNAVTVDRASIDRHLNNHLPRYKHPRRIWLCRALPMTQSGKVAAGTLKQWIVDGHDALEPFV
ncbi:class I adenylate-forming enzyme family protein [Ensifer sp. 4252]|uniref:class I adenylate-forming enzyme family protein n=1 Tax=Ensifer sp. 4252 TaxID=3373915 RepID=UPI003D22DC18